MGVKLFKISAALFALLITASCEIGKKSKSDIEIEFVQDTLNVGYTYWWPQSGPFIGSCGDELSFVFVGTVTDLLEPTDDAGPLYTPQQGFIRIERVFKIKDLGSNNYANQQFFTSDCFHGMEIGPGDQVLIFCYDYEDDYTIPGKSSILKINGLDDPIIKSIRKYIDSDQDPNKLLKDMELWKKYGLKEDLQQIIDCKKEMGNLGDETHLTE